MEQLHDQHEELRNRKQNWQTVDFQIKHIVDMMHEDHREPPVIPPPPYRL